MISTIALSSKASFYLKGFLKFTSLNSLSMSLQSLEARSCSCISLLKTATQTILTYSLHSLQTERIVKSYLAFKY